MDSYGYIETYGYVTSIVAADEALKAADVTLTNLYFVKGGIVTVEFSGDVASVKIAIEVGSECARELGNYLSSNVIARVASETKKILKREGRNEKSENSLIEEKSQEEAIIENESIENTQVEMITEVESAENAEEEVIEKVESVKSTEEVIVEAESVENSQAEEISGTESKTENENKEIENKRSEEKEAIKKLRKKYQDMRVIELKTKVNKLKTEHTWNQIKGMTKKKLIEILIKHDQEE